MNSQLKSYWPTNSNSANNIENIEKIQMVTVKRISINSFECMHVMWITGVESALIIIHFNWELINTDCVFVHLNLTPTNLLLFSYYISHNQCMQIMDVCCFEKCIVILIMFFSAASFVRMQTRFCSLVSQSTWFGYIIIAIIERLAAASLAASLHTHWYTFAAANGAKKPMDITNIQRKIMQNSFSTKYLLIGQRARPQSHAP